MDWTLKRVPAEDVRAHMTCLSGSRPCRAEPPARPSRMSATDVADWAWKHTLATGHTRFELIVSSLVECEVRARCE
ncbi:DUF7848 domain-containing protein [Streptomyces tsukubensis]